MATGTRLMQEISDQFLNCKICFENFREPKMLSCLHTFCCDCIQQQYESEVTSRSSRFNIYTRGVTCPLCRKKTELPTGGVRRLPDNFLVSNLTNVLAKKSATSVPPCDICHSVRGSDVEACSKCLDCNKLLCKGCVDMHMSTKVTQQHSLIDLEGEKNIECKVHPEENIRFYCEPCESCICVVCTFQEHKDHDVCSLTDGFNKYKSDLDDLLVRSKKRVEVVTSRLQAIKRYEAVVKGVKENIRDLAISYIAEIRSKEKELMKKMEEVYGDKMQELKENKPILEENLEELQNACNLTDIMLNERGVESLLLKKELETKMTHLMDLSLPEVPESKEYEVTFVPGETVLGALDFACENNDDDVDKSKINDKSELIDPKSFVDPDLISNCTQTESCRMQEISTSMSADMTVNFSHTNSQTDLTKTGIEELYKKQNEINNETKDSKTPNFVSVASQNKTNEVTPPPDLLPANSFTYTPGRWIRSRKIQTDICNIDFSREMSDREYVHALLVVDSYHNTQNSQAARREESNERARPAARRMSNATTMTTQEVGNGPLFNDNETRKRNYGRRDAYVSAVCDSNTVNTQTPIKILKDSMTLTDGHCQEDKWTCMPSVEFVDRETATTRIYTEERMTFTDLISTSDRATSTVGPKVLHKAIGTIPPKADHMAVQVTPQTQCMSSNTPTIQTQEKHIQACKDVMDQGTIPDADIEMKYSNQNTAESSVDSPSSIIPVVFPSSQSVQTCDRASDAFKPPTSSKATETPKVKTISTASETFTPKYVDRETGTNVIKTLDRWTETPKPQLVSTGITPPRPATLDMGVATIVIDTNDEATCTDVVSYRSVQSETTLVVCDNETITEHPTFADAQTSVEISKECAETETEPWEEKGQASTNTETVETVTHESHATQCDVPVLHTRETNTTRSRRRAKESQTDYSFVACYACNHLNMDGDTTQNGIANDDNNESDTSRKDGVLEKTKVCLNTQEVGTMAISCATCQHNHQGIQTQSPIQLDKASATSFEFDQDFLVRTLSREYQDAATSTDSLPYIGLLSEIDVDELIVIPEAAFELVSDSDSELDHWGVEMVDSETFTDYLQYVETGTQTIGVEEINAVEDTSVERTNGKGVGEIIKSMVLSEGSVSVFSNDGSENSKKTSSISVESAASKHIVSIGVNTPQKVTFEKETCTPMRHLFSKGTMTFFVSKLDKSTSTLTGSKTCDGSAKPGGARGSGMVKTKSVDKITMTSRAEHKDIGVVTDKADIDGRIGDCISKLRNVSERLNSPTSRKPAEASFFEKGFGSSYVKTVNDATANKASSNVNGDKSSSSNKTSSTASNNKTPSIVNNVTSNKTSSTATDNKASSILNNATTNKLSSTANTTKVTSTVNDVTANKTSSTSKEVTSNKPAPNVTIVSTAISSPTITTTTSPSHDTQKTSNNHKETNTKGITLDNLDLKESFSITKTNDKSPVRKPQPITTLKGRKPVNVKGAQENISADVAPNTTKEGESYDSKSLPRQFVLNRPRPVKMGSQPLTPSRLPLLRYNSAPDEMTTVPPHMITTKPQGRTSPLHSSNSPSPRTSPSKIPITKKPSPPEKTIKKVNETNSPQNSNVKKPCAPDDIWIKKPTSPTRTVSSSSSSEESQTAGKPKLRRPLPSITETRTPSTCSDTSRTSFVSANSSSSAAVESTASSSKLSSHVNANRQSFETPAAEDAKLKAKIPSSTSTMSSSMIASNTESLTDSVFKKSSTETLHSAASSDTLEETTSSSTQKKSGMGFMQRFLGKRKKNQESKKEPQPQPQPAVAKPGPQTGALAKALVGATLVPQAPPPDSQAHGANLQLPPHHYPPQPESKSPMPSRKSRPFVYVRQRIFPIEDVEEKKTKDDKEPPASTPQTTSTAKMQKNKESAATNTGKEKAGMSSGQVTEKEKVKSKPMKGSKSKKSEQGTKTKVECKHGKGGKKK